GFLLLPIPFFAANGAHQLAQLNSVVFANSRGDRVAAGAEVMNGQLAGVCSGLLLLPAMTEIMQPVADLFACRTVGGSLCSEVGNDVLACFFLAIRFGLRRAGSKGSEHTDRESLSCLVIDR